MRNHKFGFGVQEIWELIRICVVMEVMGQMLLFPGSRKKKGKKVREGRRKEGRIIIFLGLLEQSTLQTRAKHNRNVLSHGPGETSSLKSRCWQGHDPLLLTEEPSSPPLVSCSLLGVLWFAVANPVPISSLHRLPPCVYMLYQILLSFKAHKSYWM